MVYFKYQKKKSLPPVVSILPQRLFISSLENHARNVCYNSKDINFNCDLYKDIFVSDKIVKKINSISIASDKMAILNTNGGKYKEKIIRQLSSNKIPLIVSYFICNLDNIDELFLQCLRKYKLAFIIILPIYNYYEYERLYTICIKLQLYKPVLIQLMTPGLAEDSIKNRLSFFHLARKVLELRKCISIPLLLYPELYIASKFYDYQNVYVVGIISGSPFDYSNLATGDIILRSNGIFVSSCIVFKHILSIFYKENLKIDVNYIRDNIENMTFIKPNDYTYPYCQIPFISNLGCIVNGFSSVWLVNEIKRIVNEREHEYGVLFVSRLTYNLYTKIFYEYKSKLKICTVTRKIPSVIDMGNVFSVEDYVRTIKKMHYRIDYILLASSCFFDINDKKVDFRGKSYHIIEKLTNIKVILVESNGVFL